MLSDTPHATVLVPTHDHAHLIGYSLRSIQEQSFADFELFVVGDGANEETRDVVADLARNDARIHYFSFPKGARNGEAHRDIVLKQARGEIVAYCGDDDIWLSDHLAEMSTLLTRCDFGHLAQVNVHKPGRYVVFRGTMSKPRHRHGMLEKNRCFFGLTVGGHTMAAYRSLPVGWSPAPIGTPTDQNMWRKLLRQPGLRFGGKLKATSIHIVSPQRTDWTRDQRTAELADLFDRRNSPELRDELDAAIRRSFKVWSPNHYKLPRRLLWAAESLMGQLVPKPSRHRHP